MFSSRVRNIVISAWFISYFIFAPTVKATLSLSQNGFCYGDSPPSGWFFDADLDKFTFYPGEPVTISGDVHYYGECGGDELYLYRKFDSGTWDFLSTDSSRSSYYYYNESLGPAPVGLGSHTIKLGLTSSANSTRQSDTLGTITVALAKPTITAAAPQGCGTGEIKVSWNDVPGATGYEISIDGGTPIALGDTLTTTADLLTANQTYGFRVRATVAGQAGAWSSSVNATAPAICPSVQLNFL